MKTITIDKDRLKQILLKNRQIHDAEYQEVAKAFTAAALEEAKQMVIGFGDGNINTKLYIKADYPRSSIASYDLAIEMLDHEVEAVVTITDKEFRNFIKDDWDWTNSFAATKSAYGIS